MGGSALSSLTSGFHNNAIGQNAGAAITTAYQNNFMGYGAGGDCITGNRNVAIGNSAATGDFNGSVILGSYATATANNQFVIGSSIENAGSVATETNTSSKVWNVIINGVARKILLA